MKLPPLRSLVIGCAAIAVAISSSSCTRYQPWEAAMGSLGGRADRGFARADSNAGGVRGTGATGGESVPRASGDQPAALQPAVPRKRAKGDYPIATPIQGRSGQVISPFKPHNVIDVRGINSGQYARDPSTAPIDPDTGKPDLTKAKIFEVP